MDRVGTLCSNFVDENRIEWRRLLGLKPVRFSAILYVTKLGESLPVKACEFDREIACVLCGGGGKILDGLICPKCKGDGKKIANLMKQRPRNAPVSRGYFSLMP